MSRSAIGVGVCLFIFGCLTLSLESWAENQDDGLVEVEPSFVVVGEGPHDRLVSYQDRRDDQGIIVSIGQSNMNFPSYQPNYSAESFSEAYGDGKGVMVDLNLGVKFNFSFFSIGPEMGISSYSVTSRARALVASQLSLTNIRAGARLFVDGIFAEPYVVPYGCAGFYVMQFKETSAANSFDGNTSPATYFCAGLQFQLNRIEPAASVRAYEEQGLENSFFYLEARLYSASQFEQDINVNFETDPSLLAGLALEF